MKAQISAATARTVYALVGGTIGLVAGALLGVLIAQATVGRIGKPLEDEGFGGLVGGALGLVVGIWLGWRVAGRRYGPTSGS